MDLATLLLTEKYVSEKTKNIPGYLESVRNELKAIQIFISSLALERSGLIIQHGQIDSLGGGVAAGVVGGIVNMSLKGRTGRNILEDGNFPDGTVGWISSGGNNTISDNTLINTGGGSHPDVATFKYFHPMPIEATEIFLRARIRFDNPDCTRMRFQIAGATGTVTLQTILNPENGKEYVLSGIVSSYTALTGDTIRTYFVHQYPDAATANGKSMEVQEVFALDLTAEGLAGKTADEINTMFPDWFDGTQSAGPKRVKVVGKNLFDRGLPYVEIDANNIRVNNIRLEADTSHYISYDQSLIIGEHNTRVIYDNNVVNHIVSTGMDTEFATSSYTNYQLNMYFVNGIFAQNIRLILDSIQIEESTTATAYEPYKQSLAYTPEVGRSLPNGVADVVDVNEGVMVKNITDPIILDGSIDENWKGLGGSDTTYINFRFESSELLGTYPNPKIQGTPRVIHDILIKNISTTQDTEGHVNGVSSDPTYFGIRVLRSRLATEDFAGLRTWLASNPITFFYQLAEPVPIQLDIPPQNLLSFENGTLLQEHCIGEVNFYGSNCPVSNVSYPIREIDFIKKVDQATGAATVLGVNTAVVAGDGLSFTHPDLTIGDLVDWDYYYSAELSTLAELEYTVPLANVKDIARALGTEGEVF